MKLTLDLLLAFANKHVQFSFDPKVHMQFAQVRALG